MGRIREEVLVRVQKIFEDQLGGTVPIDKPIREEIGATSLDMASAQISFEDEFKLEFGAGGRVLPIDDVWTAAKTVSDFTDMVMRFAP